MGAFYVEKGPILVNIIMLTRFEQKFHEVNVGSECEAKYDSMFSRGVIFRYFKIFERDCALSTANTHTLLKCKEHPL